MQTAARLHDAAWQALRERRFADAVATCRELTDRFPRHAPGWNVSSHVLLAIKQGEKALQSADHAARLDPGDPSHQVQRAYCLLALARRADAGIAVERAAELPCENPSVMDNIGTLFSLTGKQQQALHAFERAAELRPEDAHIRFNLATVKQSFGDLDGAEKEFNLAIRHNPRDYEAYLHRSRLRRQDAGHNHVGELQQLLNSTELPWRGRMILLYAIGKEYEDLGDYERSFEALREGAGLRRAHMEYDVRKDVAIMDGIRRYYPTAGGSTDFAGHDGDAPIFIVGLPRTGTTLVERLVATSDSVFAAGELNDFAVSLMAQAKAMAPGATPSGVELVRLSTQMDFARLGRDYVESTRPHIGQAPRFVDKLPLNFLYCGLIARALPRAKIVHVRRNPMDACFAMFKTLFQQAYPFSYDLDDLAEYYGSYHMLMSHWESALPGRLIHLDYEGLVKDLKGMSQKLFDRLELEWDPRVLHFHEQITPSLTASLAQIRQPVYASSVGRWRKYESHLAPLKSAFEAAGIL